MASWLTKPRVTLSQEEHDWGDKLIAADQLPPELDGRDVTIAVLDSGVDSRHLDLNLQIGFDVVAGTRTRNLRDKIGHGTFVAGIAAAERNSLGPLGVSPGVRLIACRIGKVDPVSGAYTTDIVSGLIRGIEWAISERADVINMSLELRHLRQSSLARINAALTKAARKGIVLVAAAGNDGLSVAYPARSPLVLSVGAVGNTDLKPLQSARAREFRSKIYIPKFSSPGPGLDVLAPGVQVPSTMPGFRGPYGLGVGTSFAAPYVAGVCALLVQAARPARTHSIEFVERVSGIVRATANSMRNIPTQYQGSGILSAVAAVERV